MRRRTDCASLFTDAGRDERRNAGYDTPVDSVDIHHQEIVMGMSRAQGRNEATGDGIRDQLRHHVEKIRDEKSVCEVDFDRSGDTASAA